MSYSFDILKKWAMLQGVDVQDFVYPIYNKYITFDSKLLNEMFRIGRFKETDFGIRYLDDDKIEYYGFLFLPEYNISVNSKPRAHVRNCGAMMRAGVERYQFSNKPSVRVRNRNTGSYFKDVVLDICEVCRNHANYKLAKIRNTTELYLQNEAKIREEVEQRIRKNYFSINWP